MRTMIPRRRTSTLFLYLETLESRQAPSGTPWLTENFDTTAAGALPTGWSEWNTDGVTVGVSATTGVNNTSSLDIAASVSRSAAHAWYNVAASADVQVTAAIQLNSLIPAQILARGSNLNSAGASYYGLSLTRGLDLQLLRVVNGTTTVLADLPSASWFSDVWVNATLQVQGNSLSAQLVRTDTGQYLNSAGQWQSAQTWAAQVSDSTITQAGQVGFARPGSYTGTLHFDEFSATLLPALPGTTLTESFDTTTPGTLPAGWTQYASDGSTAFTVSNVTALSAPNGLAVNAGISWLSARAWMLAAQSSDVQVSSAVLLNSLIPAQLLARGSGLDTSTPSYYALSLTRGLDLQLLSVVNGNTTVLAELQSASWFSDVWVRATLTVTGSTLQAQVVRVDTGAYLNTAGQWQAAPTTALSTSDITIPESSLTGLVGLARPASYTGTITFDDFAMTALAPPAPSTGLSESFDATSPGTLPAGWTQFTTDGSTVFSVSNAAALSAPNGLAAVASTSSVSAIAWPTAPQPTDVVVTAAVFLNSLIPAQLVARGSALNTSAPSYYALSLTRGLDLQLQRVVNGTTTVLADLSSASWFSDKWVRATLFVNGFNVRAQVFRPDTGQFLSLSGQWQSNQTWALNITDMGITQGNNVGLARPGSYAGTITFDDFSVQAATGSSQPPRVTITTPSAATTLTGVVGVNVSATSTNSTVTRVEFYIDSVLRAASTAAPYHWDFDTSTASNGTHTLTVLAYDLFGNVGQAVLQVTTQNNTALPRPSIPQHYPNIRIAELAYNSGQTFGSFEDNLLQNSVDLVVSDQAFAQHINSVAPNTPQALYTNVSNVYLDSLTDWLNYADAHNLDRESAFYHVTQPTSFIGTSSSSIPVTWFWGIYRGGTTLTDVTFNGHNGGRIPFGALGESVYVGYTDKFREINLIVPTPAGPGWSDVLEYANGVDANGNPTSWAPLTTITNTTSNMHFSGQITFDPPSDWKTASINGSVRLFYVRFRTVSSGTAPVATSILGRDYVNAAGSNHGVIPVFDTAADLNHDGYLNDAEYANRAPGDDARFLYESRLFYPGGGQMRFVTNPSTLGYRQWAADFNVRYLNAHPLDSALFVDNSGGNSPVGGVQVAEPTASYTTDYAGLLNAIGQAIAPRWILANTAGGGTSADPVIQRVQAYFDEFVIRPLAANYQQFEDIASTFARRAALTSPSPYAILDSMPTNGSPTDSRTQLATLAYYYLLADPTTTFLDFYGGFAPGTSWTQHWSPAAAYNIGAPQGAWSLFASGTDPDNTALTFRVYQRSFANALVLYKPLSADATGTILGSLNTATTFALNGTYRPLQADGTLGAPETSVTLRNGEGAILIRS
jgi:hypothetical protein